MTTDESSLRESGSTPSDDTDQLRSSPADDADEVRSAGGGGLRAIPDDESIDVPDDPVRIPDTEYDASDRDLKRALDDFYAD
ncbi:hypothetical protein [Halorussus caseinilyticus]|uniref:Uncharacterized protein n=1 Tax=Halorussus caseinilyticus TaxID=3034025 RepID=A0ABD5WPL3_9EURY|nr:hypothetical protein [Halorussus sp. DT72]